MTRPPSNPPGEFAKQVASAIRRELGEHRLSGRALGRIIGQSESYVRSRIKDKLQFELNDIEAFANYLEITPEAFIARIEHSAEILRFTAKADLAEVELGPEEHLPQQLRPVAKRRTQDVNEEDHMP